MLSLNHFQIIQKFADQRLRGLFDPIPRIFLNVGRQSLAIERPARPVTDLQLPTRPAGRIVRAAVDDALAQLSLSRFQGADQGAYVAQLIGDQVQIRHVSEAAMGLVSKGLKP